MDVMDAMDVMGIERQLILPQVVLALPAWSDHPNAATVLHEYNDAVLRWTAAGQGRLRPAALLNLTTIEGAITEAERVAAGGARAVFIQDGIAPGGRSPAAPEVDPLWALLAEADMPVTCTSAARRASSAAMPGPAPTSSDPAASRPVNRSAPTCSPPCTSLPRTTWPA